MKAFRRPCVRSSRPSRRLWAECLEARTVPAGLSADLLVGLRTASGVAVEYRSEAVPAGVSQADALAAWRSTPGVTVAEPEQVYQAALTPNDPSYGQLYAQNNTGQSGGTVDADMDAPEAWNVVTGSATTVVAVIDTGVDYTHPDLYKNVWLNQNEIPAAVKAVLTDTDGDGRITFWDLNESVNQGAGKITDLNNNGRIDGGDVIKPVAQGGWADGSATNDGNTYTDDLIGWDFVGNDNDPMDVVAENGGHGTHVAGTIGAIGNNGVGVVGVAWKASIMPVRFLGTNGGSTSNAVKSINYSAANGAVVSNNSWGGGGYSGAMLAAIQGAGTAGQVFVAAAGNAGTNNDVTPFYPASYTADNVVAVAATDRNDALASFSCYGATSVDLAAGGVSIYSTYPGGYATMSGTSMATPQASGALALVRGQNTGLTYAQAIARVLSTVDVLPPLAGKTVTGGRLNAYAAVYVTPPADTDGPAVTAMAPNATGPNPVSAVRLTFDEAIDPASFLAADVSVAAPGGGAVAVAGVAAVAGTANTQFDVTFAAQSAVGTYTVAVGPQVLDVAGNPMDQNNNGTNGEDPADKYGGSFAVTAPAPTPVTFTNNTPLPVPDRSSQASPIAVGQDLTIGTITVTLNVAHLNVGDLQIRLWFPGWSASVPLITSRGGSGDNLTATVFADAATTPIASGTAPFTGSFRPETPLAPLTGRNARGTWYLVVSDWTPGNAGTLLNWSMTITPAG